MGRKRNQTGLMDAVATLPWPAGVVLGIVGFLGPVNTKFNNR